MATTIYQGDSREALKTLADDSIDCCVTSPPYWGLRNYGAEQQIGAENCLEEYIAALVAVFSEVKRLLRPHGTLWLNLGDSYSVSGKGGGSQKQLTNIGSGTGKRINKPPLGLKQKDLIGVPWRVAFALQADGWFLRSDIVWHKPNPMPESVKDRPTRAHEYIFLLSKSPNYYYDYQAIREPLKASSASRLSQNLDLQQGSDRANGGNKTNGAMKAVLFGGNKHQGYGTTRHSGNEWLPDSSGGMANKKSVWTVGTAGFRDAHFATFPPKLIVPCIKAGCPEGGTVLDPFFGAGTTGLVANRLGRQCVGIELNESYTLIAQERICKDSGLFSSVKIQRLTN